MAGAGSRDRTATSPIDRACHSWDMDVPSLQPLFLAQPPGTCNTLPGHAPQHCLGPWPRHGCRVLITRSQACPELSNHSLPQFPFLVLTCFTSRGYPQHQLRGGTSPSPPPPPHTLPWVLQCSSATKGPSAPRALGAIALARTCLAAQPWPCSSPRFNDGRTCPPGVPSQGALEKQPRPGMRPVGMDGSELGACACDHPPVCKHARAHRWMFSHTRAFPCSSCTHARL